MPVDPDPDLSSTLNDCNHWEADVHTPLNALASTAGALFSSSSFEMPQLQREYSWEKDEISDFWNDLQNALGDESYFLGLIILTEEKRRKQVVDGQQRLLTVTLLAAALYHEAKQRGRNALAERIQADFLRSIDYETDKTDPRLILTDAEDNAALSVILDYGSTSAKLGKNTVADTIYNGFELLRSKLKSDLAEDPFKRLGIWTDFLTNHLYFAVFIHPDPASAYKVFEVVNTRGRDLTTADLLKNYILQQTSVDDKDARYKKWRKMAKQFLPNNTSSFVQYIRHVVTVQNGHILPKDLFDFLALRREHGDRRPPTASELMQMLDENLSLYMQMIDPTLAGPAEPEALKIFAALNHLGVISVRPILLAISKVPSSLEGMKIVLKLVVRRIVVGNLGTGNVERRFGEIAKKIRESNSWMPIQDDLSDLNPPREEFISQLIRRSFNKSVLAFMRNSILAKEVTPDSKGTLHFIMPRNTVIWDGFSEEDASFWGNTIGNTFLSSADRRLAGSSDWRGFKSNMLPTGIDDEWKEKLESLDIWTSSTVEQIGKDLAEVAGEVWY